MLSNTDVSPERKPIKKLAMINASNRMAEVLVYDKKCHVIAALNVAHATNRKFQ